MRREGRFPFDLPPRSPASVVNLRGDVPLTDIGR